MLSVYLKRAVQFGGAWLCLVFTALVVSALARRAADGAALVAAFVAIGFVLFMVHTAKRTFRDRRTYQDETVRCRARRDFGRRGWL